jgi:hypothetical protein
MYLQEILGILQSHEVKIKYDCDGGFENCSQERMLKLRYAEKNFNDNGGKHICRKCQLKAKNPMKKQEIKDKVKKTCEEKYGGMPMNSQEQIKKRKEKFQDENYKKQWVEKHRSTSLEKYGVEHPMHLESTKIKQKQTMQEKYGVDHPYQSPEIMEKMKQKNLEKYGVENVAQLPEVQIKMAQTTLEKYGVEHYNELPEMREYLRQNCPQWLSESWANGGPMKGIIRPEEWNQKARDTVLAAIQNGTWKGGGKHSLRGRIDVKKCRKANPWFRSSYELKAHLWLENSQDVKSYDYEPFKINYVGTDGHSRYYFPDFLVFWIDANRKPTLIEVKNSYMLDAEINLSKNKSAIKYAKENGFDFEVWDDDKIYSLNINLVEFQCDNRISIERGKIQ